jgi:hypothetical protein
MSLQPIEEDVFDFDDDVVTNRYGCAMSLAILAVGYPIMILLSPILVPLCTLCLWAHAAVWLWQTARDRGPGLLRRGANWIWRKTFGPL